MLYNNVKYLYVNQYSNNSIHYLEINGIQYIWEVRDNYCCLCDRNNWPYQRFTGEHLKIKLELDTLNPKKSVKEYYKLLILQ